MGFARQLEVESLDDSQHGHPIAPVTPDGTHSAPGLPASMQQVQYHRHYQASWTGPAFMPAKAWYFHSGDDAESRLIPVAMSRARNGNLWSMDQFVLTQQLYQSCRSKVFDAMDRQSGRRVALKLYIKSQLNRLIETQVEREVNIQLDLEHPNIIKLYAAFSDDENVYLVQEYADGGDLFKKVQVKGSRCSETSVQVIMASFLGVLQYLHDRGIMHRDIKPENILLASDGSIKVADFGLAIDLNEERPVTRLGTLEYMAPEVLVNPDKNEPEENKDNDAMVYSTQADVWAAGVLAFELLVGRAPFESDDFLRTFESILNTEPLLPAWLSKNAKTFIKAALCKDAHRRSTIPELLRHPWIAGQVPLRVGSGGGSAGQGAAQQLQQPQQQPQPARWAAAPGSAQRQADEGPPVATPARGAPPLLSMFSPSKLQTPCQPAPPAGGARVTPPSPATLAKHALYSMGGSAGYRGAPAESTLLHPHPAPHNLPTRPLEKTSSLPSASSMALPKLARSSTLDPLVLDGRTLLQILEEVQADAGPRAPPPTRSSETHHHHHYHAGGGGWGAQAQAGAGPGALLATPTRPRPRPRHGPELEERSSAPAACSAPGPASPMLEPDLAKGQRPRGLSDEGFLSMESLKPPLPMLSPVKGSPAGLRSYVSGPASTAETAGADRFSLHCRPLVLKPNGSGKSADYNQAAAAAEAEACSPAGHSSGKGVEFRPFVLKPSAAIRVLDFGGRPDALAGDSHKPLALRARPVRRLTVEHGPAPSPGRPAGESGGGSGGGAGHRPFQLRTSAYQNASVSCGALGRPVRPDEHTQPQGKPAGRYAGSTAAPALQPVHSASALFHGLASPTAPSVGAARTLSLDSCYPGAADGNAAWQAMYSDASSQQQLPGSLSVVRSTSEVQAVNCQIEPGGERHACLDADLQHLVLGAAPLLRAESSAPVLTRAEPSALRPGAALERGWVHHAARLPR